MQTLPHIGLDWAFDILTLEPISDLSQLSAIKGIGQARLADIKQAGVVLQIGGVISVSVAKKLLKKQKINLCDLGGKISKWSALQDSLRRGEISTYLALYKNT